MSAETKAENMGEQQFDTQVTPIPLSGVLHRLRGNPNGESPARLLRSLHMPKSRVFLSDSVFLGAAYGGSVISGLITESFKCNHDSRKSVFLKTLPIMALKTPHTAENTSAASINVHYF